MSIRIQGVTIIDEQTSYIDFALNSAIKIPSGSVGERPAGVDGLVRFNTTDGIFEFYNGSSWSQVQGQSSEGALRAVISDVAPSEPSAGKLWWDTTTATLKIYYDDGATQQWVNASPTLDDNFVEDVYDPTNYIFTPSGNSPSEENFIITNSSFTLTSSAYNNSIGTPHASSDWQIASNTSFLSTDVESLADTANKTSYTVTGGLPDTGTYYWRVRYRDEDGFVSNFSEPKEFTISPPPELGDSYCGGFYIGTICAASTCYYIIVAPNASGCACCQWKTTRTTTAGTTSLVDGYTTTYGLLNNATHPAGNWTATRTIGGFSDWYLPAKDELAQLYTNKGSAPAGEGFSADAYWSSTELSATVACARFLSNGIQLNYFKTFSSSVRAVRRQPI